MTRPRSRLHVLSGRRPVCRRPFECGTGLSSHAGIDLAAIALGQKYESFATPRAASISDSDRKAFAGRFAHPQIGTFAITEDAGELYLRWGDSEQRKYLTPVSATTLFNREEFSFIERNPAAPDELSIRWGNDPQKFQRVALP